MVITEVKEVPVWEPIPDELLTDVMLPKMKVTGNPDDVDAFIIDTYEIIKQTNIRLKMAREYTGKVVSH